MSPAALISIGFVLLLVGWAILFLTVIKILAPSFVLSMGAYALSFAGMLIGFVGLFEHRKYR